MSTCARGHGRARRSPWRSSAAPCFEHEVNSGTLRRWSRYARLLPWRGIIRNRPGRAWIIPAGWSDRPLTFTLLKHEGNLACLRSRVVDVVLVRWPKETEHRDRLAAKAGPGCSCSRRASLPPLVEDPLEDWVRIPAPDTDVRARLDTLALRGPAADAVRQPTLDDDGVIRHNGVWASLPPVEARHHPAAARPARRRREPREPGPGRLARRRPGPQRPRRPRAAPAPAPGRRSVWPSAPCGRVATCSRPRPAASAKARPRARPELAAQRPAGSGATAPRWGSAMLLTTPQDHPPRSEWVGRPSPVAQRGQ